MLITSNLPRYASFRKVDNGEHANHIYMFDGGSLAHTDKREIDGKTYELQHTRVGEHHNTPFYSSYAADANTILAVPLDMNLWAIMLPNVVKLHDHGRLVCAFCPTVSYGALH